jgi:hypothetical protein
VAQSHMRKEPVVPYQLVRSTRARPPPRSSTRGRRPPSLVVGAVLFTERRVRKLLDACDTFRGMYEAGARCSVCGAVLSARQLLYDPDGNVICEACSKREVAAATQEARKTAIGLAYGNPLLAFASFFFNPSLILSLGAVGNGLYIFKRIQSDAARREGGPTGLAPRLAVKRGIGAGFRVKIGTRFKGLQLTTEDRVEPNEEDVRARNKPSRLR